MPHPRCALLVLAVTQAQALARADEEPLALKVVDPLYFQFQLQLENKWTPSTWDADGTADTVQFRSVMPFRAWGRENLARVTVPFDATTTDGKTGVGTTEIMDLVIFRPSWGAFGAGLVADLAPGGGSGGAFQIGPALGLTAQAGRWKLGILVRCFFGVDAASTIFEPIASYAPVSWFAVGLGELQIDADWWNTTLTEAPLSLEVDFTPTVGGQKLRFWVNPLYNLASDSGNYRWRVTVGFALVGD
jgi:hypothetical protein